MIVKAMRKGRCGLKYCLGVQNDYRSPFVLAGDPRELKGVLAGIDFANQFTSIALCFDTQIDETQQRCRILEFEENLLPGLRPGVDYARVWIRHNEYQKDLQTRKPILDGQYKTSLHMIIANIYLLTGKRLQPYFDPIDRPRVEAWQELTNLENNYTSPKDPERRRAAAFHTTAQPQNIANLKIETAKAIVRRIKDEVIGNRDDLIKWLGQVGYKIERITKKSISVSVSNHNRNIRFEGALYELRGIENAIEGGQTKMERSAGEKAERIAYYRGQLEESLNRKLRDLETATGRRPRQKAGRPRKNVVTRVGEATPNHQKDDLGIIWSGRTDDRNASDLSIPPGQHGTGSNPGGSDSESASYSGSPVHGGPERIVGNDKSKHARVAGTKSTNEGANYTEHQPTNIEKLNQHELNTIGEIIAGKISRDGERAREAFRNLNDGIRLTAEFFKKQFRFRPEDRQRIDGCVGRILETNRRAGSRTKKHDDQIRAVDDTISKTNRTICTSAHGLPRDEIIGAPLMEIEKRINKNAEKAP